MGNYFLTIVHTFPNFLKRLEPTRVEPDFSSPLQFLKEG